MRIECQTGDYAGGGWGGQLSMGFHGIDSLLLQSIPTESNDKDVAAMLDELTIEPNKESFVIVLQHGGNDVTCKRSILVVC